MPIPEAHYCNYWQPGPGMGRGSEAIEPRNRNLLHAPAADEIPIRKGWTIDVDSRSPAALRWRRPSACLWLRKGDWSHCRARRLLVYGQTYTHQLLTCLTRPEPLLSAGLLGQAASLDGHWCGLINTTRGGGLSARSSAQGPNFCRHRVQCEGGVYLPGKRGAPPRGAER